MVTFRSTMALPLSAHISILVVVICTTIFYLIYRVRKFNSGNLQALHLPVFDCRGDDSGIVAALEKGHEQYPTKPFALAVPGQQLVVLPVSEIDTVKALPESVLSIKKHHYNQFLGEHSYMGTKTDEFDKTMRHDLVRNTPAVLAAFVAEIDYATTQMVGAHVKPGQQPQQWIQLKPRAAMGRMATILSGRSFVGLPLSRDEEWIEANVNFTGGVSKAWVVLRFWPHFLRPIVAPFLREVRSLESCKALIRKKLGMLLEQRKRKTGKKGRTDGSGPVEPGGELLDWFQSQYEHPPSVQELTRDQLMATFASIYNLSNALTYVMFDLAADPAMVEELREEVDRVLGFDGVLDKITIMKLLKLDSFVRESQRMSPTSLVNIPRIVTKPTGLRLSTGDVVPPGYLAMVRAQPINQSATFWERPEKFDAFRFARQREQPGNASKFQHTSTGPDNINFGHGLWACPGRFFASAEIKVVIVHFIRNFDLRLLPGQEKPTPLYRGLAIFPNAEAQVEIRPRK